MAFWYQTTGLHKTPKKKNHRKLSNKSRVYCDVNKYKPPKYWSYADTSISWSNVLDMYEVSKRIGGGKYSDVYEAFNIVNNQKCVIKCLKPVNKSNIQREIQILITLCGGTNIIHLLDVLKDEQTRIPILVLEYIDAVQFKSLIVKLSDFDIRYYTRQLLKALDYAHSNGIMHRDVKPGNILIDHNKKILKLIDWGLSDYYHESKDYSVRVGTKFYKAPELLVEMTDYDYGIDLWSVGCIVASMIFKISPFFKGEDNIDQLVKIVDILGSDLFYTWIDKYGIILEEELKTKISHHKLRVSWQKFITTEIGNLAHDVALDFLDKLFCYDPQVRLTAREALAHPYMILHKK